MNNLTNTILAKVTDLAQTSGAIANVADKLLNRILLKENAAAQIPFCRLEIVIPICGKCVSGVQNCRLCCSGSPSRCFSSFRRAC